MICFFDFDGTLADTYTQAPSGIGVEEAYNMAVFHTFGDKGLDFFLSQGGLKGREPRELARDLSLALYRTTSPEQIAHLTEQLVKVKLDCLLAQIDTTWPRLYPGVKEFFTSVHEQKIPVDIGIISSGHDAFIKKVLEAHDLRPPQILVTSDAIRKIENPNRDKHKPHLFQLAKGVREWVNSTHPQFNGSRKRASILYIGDDPEKDGKLAEYAQVPFGFVPHTHPHFSPDSSKGQFLIPDLLTFTRQLEKTSLPEGRPFAEVIFNKKDSELFPYLPHHERPYQRLMMHTRNKERV